MKDLNETEWQLIVNGKQKPWPIEDYMNTPITIDLNWGLDSCCYEADVVTFTVHELEAGKVIPHVQLNKAEKRVVCVIPVKEKEKRYKIFIDWTSTKKTVYENLVATIGNNKVQLTDGILTLRGKELSSKYEILYCGKPCKITQEDVNLLRVCIPVNEPVKSSILPKTAKGWIGYFMPGVLLSLVLGLVGLLGYYVLFPSYTEQECTQSEAHIIDRIESSSNEIFSFEEIGEKSESNIQHSSARESVSYLQEHERWCKHDMERFPELHGLFDAMNDFRFKNALDIIERLEFDAPSIERLTEAFRVAMNDQLCCEEKRKVYTHDDCITIKKYCHILERRDSTLKGRQKESEVTRIEPLNAY